VALEALASRLGQCIGLLGSGIVEEGTSRHWSRRRTCCALGLDASHHSRHRVAIDQGRLDQVGAIGGDTGPNDFKDMVEAIDIEHGRPPGDVTLSAGQSIVGALADTNRSGRRTWKSIKSAGTDCAMPRVMPAMPPSVWHRSRKRRSAGCG